MYIPNYVIEKDNHEAYVEADDIFSTEAKNLLKRSKGISENNLVQHVAPDIMKVISVFKPYLIKKSSVELKYITVAISASDAPLNDMKNLCLQGMDGYYIYINIIIPSLNEFRSSY